jgi:hypothetical protein
LLVIALLPVEFHLSSFTLVDDGFYYLGYARNIALGNGPTFDGIVATNGVQPLWTFILVVVAKLFPDRVAFLHMALVVAAILAAVSAIAINDVLKHFFATPLHSAVMTFYIAFIATSQLTLTGMETTANLAIFTIALAAVLRLSRPTLWRTVGAGCLVGLTCLGRVDNLIMTPAFALLMLWRAGLLMQISSRHGLRRAAQPALWLALPVVVIFGVYIALNMTTFGRPLPVSGDVKSTHETARVEESGGRFSLNNLSETTRDAVSHYKNIANNYIYTPLLSFSLLTFSLRYVLAILLVVFSLFVLWRRRRIGMPRFSLSREMLFVLLFVTGITFLHTWLLFFQVGEHWAGGLNWYYVPEYLLFTVFLGLLLHGCARLYNNERVIYQTASIGVMGLTLVSFAVMVNPYQPPSRPIPLLYHYQATQWVNTNLSSNSIIGSFNSGVVGYFSDAPVINLDGLMNDEEILQVIRGEKRIFDYVNQHHITVLMDYTSTDWSPDTGQNFRGVPTSALRLLYQLPFDNWNYVPSTYYVFQVTAGNVFAE